MFRNYAKYIAVFASIIALHSTTIADDAARRVATHSVQLSMDDLFKFSSLYGGIISYKRHINSKNALRLGFLLSGKMETGIDSVSDNSSLRLTDKEYDTTTTASIGIQLHYLRYARPDKMIKFYYGAGPDIKHIYNSRKGRSIRGSTTDYSYWDRTKKYSFVIDGFAGFEWIFIDNISLLFEYPISAGYTLTKTRTSRGSIEESQYTHQWIFEYSRVKFGFSLYF